VEAEARNAREGLEPKLTADRLSLRQAPQAYVLAGRLAVAVATGCSSPSAVGAYGCVNLRVSRMALHQQVS
jgi:hypothetical protein